MPIETERLLLRPFHPDDLFDLHALLSDPEATAHLVPPGPRSREQAAVSLERMWQLHRQQGFGLLAVEEHGGTHLVGRCGFLSQVIDGEEELELSCLIDRARWRQGLATEAARALLEHAAKVLGRKRVVALLPRRTSPARGWRGSWAWRRSARWRCKGSSSSSGRCRWRNETAERAFLLPHRMRWRYSTATSRFPGRSILFKEARMRWLRAALICSAMAFAAVAQAQDGGAAAGAAKAPAKGAAAAGKTEVTWWGHAAFILKSPQGAVIAIDPWLNNPKAPQGAAWPATVDAVLITHGHMDHVGNAVDLAKKGGGAPIVSSYELTSLLGYDKTMPVNPGGTVKFKDVTVHAVPAIHSSGYSPDGKSAPQYGGAAMGYVIEIAGGPTLYHAGDTDVFSEMSLIAERWHPTIAMLPIGGNYTMDPTGAAMAAKLLKVKTVVPMHFGTFPVLTGTPAELSAAQKTQKGNAKIQELEIGKTVQF